MRPGADFRESIQRNPGHGLRRTFTTERFEERCSLREKKGTTAAVGQELALAVSEARVDVNAGLNQVTANHRRPLLCGVRGFGGRSGCSLVWRIAPV